MFGRSAFFALAFFGSLTVPVVCAAQDAGVSGIPRGPGNVGGLNNSINDPSGAGNRIAAPPPPSMAVPAMPSAAPATSTRVAPGPVRSIRRVHRYDSDASMPRKSRRSSSRDAVRTGDRQLDRKLRSICTGC